MKSETKRPFLLSKHKAIVVHILTRHSDETDMFWLSEAENYQEDGYNDPKQAAKDYIDALDGHCSARFLQCLSDEAKSRVDDWKKKTGR